MPLHGGDVLMQLQVQLPLAGTWRVTAGLGNSMLLHVGDVVSVRSAQECEQLPFNSSSAFGGQRPKVQLPEAFGSDDDEPLLSGSDDNPVASSCAHGSDGDAGVGVEDELAVRGAGVVSETGTPHLSYTHSGR